jgi:hypothetical protein
MNKSAKILFIGDVVGGLGKRVVLDLLPRLRDRFSPTFVVVNAENVAGGMGITPKLADQLFSGGVDVLTLGNHTYRRREIYAYLDQQDRILRPANFLRSQPGHGWCVVTRDEIRLGVISLSGSLFMDADARPFPRSTPSCTPCAIRSTTCWSTCTPRPRARRWGWAGIWTVA